MKPRRVLFPINSERLLYFHLAGGSPFGGALL